MATTGAPDWRRIAWRSAGICGAAVATLLPPIMLLAWPMAAADVASLVGDQLLDFIVVGLIVALTVHALEHLAHWPRARRRAVLASGIAVAVGIQLTWLPFDVFNSAGMHIRMERAGIADDPRAVRLHLTWFTAILASVSALYLLQRRESVEAERRRTMLEAQWQQARRRVRILRDTAGAARLDPKVLFDCLGLARREYLRDAPNADMLIDRLIDFLRSSLAATGSSPHTLGREVDQALCFAAILSRAGGVRIIDTVPVPLRQLEICPGLLLLVVQQWLTACEASSEAGIESAPLSIHASLEGPARELLCLQLDGPVVEHEALLADSRTRLGDLYGTQASLCAVLGRSGTPGLHVRFDLPLEHAHVT